MKFLACDIGNSFTKIGLYEGNNLILKNEVRNDEMSIKDFGNIGFDNLAVSSVVPEITEKIKKIFEENFGRSPLLINRHLKLDFGIAYDTPETLGIDRICGTAGVFSLMESGKIPRNDKTIFSDFGTATTINLIENHSFAGGVILPGIKTMIFSLNRGTAQLPEISESDYVSIIGKSTKSSIASGVFNSTGAIIENIYSHVFGNQDNSAPMIITGGNAGVMNRFLKIPVIPVDDLVLRGIKKIAEMN